MSQASTLLTPGYEKVTIEGQVVAFIASDFRGIAAIGNVTVVGGSDSVLVVDSGHLPTLTRRIISEIKETFKRPVRYLVNTHWHPDHWMGNSLFREEFPELVLISHFTTVRMIEKAMMEYPSRMSELFPVILSDLKEAVRTGKRKDGTILTEEDKQYRLKVSIPDLESFLAEISEMRFQPPVLVFEKSISVNLGGREVRIMHLGRGNTAGDVVVHVPDCGVLATGDLVVGPTPYAIGSFLTEWVEVLKKLRATDATTIVPGHGSIMHDWNYVETLRGMLESVTNQVGRAVEQNASTPNNTPLTLEEIRKRVNLEIYEKKLTHGDYLLKLVFQRAFVEPAVERAFLEARFAEERGA